LWAVKIIAMKIAKPISLGLLFLIFCQPLAAQEALDSLGLPGEWIGKWAGTLEIYSLQGKQQEVPMELHILPRDSCYTYTIIYGEDREAGKRDYLLKPVKPELGWYKIDEQNTIEMDAYLLNGKMYSRFDVMGSLLLSTAEVKEGVMTYEIISGKLEAIRTTGNQTFEGEDIPEVNSFPIQVRQVAYLRRL
jgi:hypothetical protein